MYRRTDIISHNMNFKLGGAQGLPPDKALAGIIVILVQRNLAGELYSVGLFSRTLSVSIN